MTPRSDQIRSTMAAFYNPPFYHTDFTHYNSYDSYCDSAQIEPPIPQSSDEPTFYNLLDYPPSPYFGQPNFNESPRSIEYEPLDHGAYGYSISYTANACSASSYSVPTVIEYDPDFYAQGYHKVSTQFAISYSVSEFNEVDFEEYDPTPYGGGYDICETYGKPLQPSIQICYPPSGTAVAISISKDPIEELRPKEKEKIKPSSKTKPTQIEKDGETEEIAVISLPDSGSGYGYGNGRELNQFPSGYGLEAMDLCETLFGHWPCLSRIKRQTACGRGNNGCGRCHGHCHCYGNYSNQWETAADYLFGSHNPYPDGRGHGDAVNVYQRQYQGQYQE